MKNRAEGLSTSSNRTSVTGKLCAIGLAGVLALSMVAMGGCAKKADDTAKAAEQTQEQTVSKVNMTFDLTAADWDKSMPIIVHITGTTAEGKAVDVYHAFTKASDTYSDLPDGTYTVEYVSPINKDGSLYTVPAKQTVTIKDGKATISATLTQVPADQVTPEQATAVIDAIGIAVAKGDDSLKGDTGKKVIADAATNAAAAPNVSTDTTAAAAGNATAAVDSAETAGVGASAGTETPAASTGGNSSASSSGGTAAAETPKTWVPEQGHNEPVYEQQWVSNWVTVVDVPEQLVKYYFCPVCGFESTVYADVANHKMATGEDGGVGLRGETIPAQIHQEDQGYYETVQTGSTYVVDVPGHWE